MKKKIVIDARLYGPTHTGIGRYTKNLLLALPQLKNFSKYEFTLLIYKNLEAEIKKDLGNHYNYTSTTISHYSLKEQIFLPFILYRLKPDLVHFTHFNRPLLFFGKSIVTIHDLIKHFFKGRETTTKNTAFYWIKYLGYLLLIKIICNTNTIIVPSNFWKDYLIKNFKIKSSKITTTHEAVDPKFLSINKSLAIKPELYILYTGNTYPHKNIKIIFEALTKLPNIKLKIISARNIFTKRTEDLINNYKIEKQVEFLGFVDDSKFKDIYKNAIALVHPSLMEGFSLTGLEAMALNCPVISSNSSCLPEVYGNSVLYFNSNNSDELVNQINKLIQSPELRQKLISLGHQQVLKYSWQKTAKITLQVYENSIIL